MGILNRGKGGKHGDLKGGQAGDLPINDYTHTMLKRLTGQLRAEQGRPAQGRPGQTCIYSSTVIHTISTVTGEICLYGPGLGTIHVSRSRRGSRSLIRSRTRAGRVLGL